MLPSPRAAPRAHQVKMTKKQEGTHVGKAEKMKPEGLESPH